MTGHAALLILASCAMISSAQTILRLSDGSNYFQADLASSSETFAEDRILAEANSFIADHPKRKLLLIRIFGNDSDYQTFYRPRSSEESFETWRAKTTMPRSYRVAEIFSDGEHSILRLRNGPLFIQRIIKGVDPLVVLDQCRLLHVYLSPKQGSDGLPRLRLFVSCPSQLTRQRSELLFQVLTERFKGFSLTVYIRPDSWFVAHQTFPNPFPFETSNPPTWLAWKHTSEAWCRGIRESTRCEVRSSEQRVPESH